MLSTFAIRRAAFASAAVFAAITAAQETGSDTCTDVHIFLARGNNEPYPGRQGKLVDAICAGLDNCDYEDIAFDNALETEYCSAVQAGGKAGTDQITTYNKRCPHTKLVVSGYSQGAQVIGDILGGAGGTFFQGCTVNSTTGLNPDSTPGNVIAAALLFGDTRHTADQSFNTLDGAPYNGLFPRTAELLAGLNNFAGVLRSWCQEKDPICAAGDGNRDTDVEDHLNYFDIYPDSAGAWVRSMVGENSTVEPGPTSGTTTTATASKEQSSSTRAAATPSVSISRSARLGTTPGTSSTPKTITTSETSTPSESSATSGTIVTTSLPEVATATDSGAAASPTTTSSNQEGGSGVVRCHKNLASLLALGSLAFLIA
ncbi:carbohydrate esterase family 5 protein [Xylariaceae sp. FL0662B]|nr:carbohydrate esterase family 5 protein [Xylariaceae sp. FL0662B]